MADVPYDPRVHGALIDAPAQQDVPYDPAVHGALQPEKPGKVAAALTNLPFVGPAIRGALALDPSLAQTPGKMLANAPQSAGNFVHALVQPFIHPIDTAKSVGSLADALMSKISRPGDLLREGDAAPTPEELQARTQREAPADAMGKFLADRFGGYKAIKNTVETDPVGASADLATLLMGGSMLPVRGAEALGRAGAVFDPITQAGNVLKGVGKVADVGLSNALGMTTGAGAQSIRTAASAGREGGEVGQVFRENMRGAPVSDVVDRAKGALDQVRQDRSQAYQAGKADLSKDTSVIPFGDIDAAVSKASEVGQFRGHSGTSPAVTIEPKAAGVVSEMQGLVSAWKSLDPAEYHTPIGIDALKRALGNIKDATQFGTPERVAANRIYNAVREEVATQAPGYSKMMEDYGRASDKINEATKTLSLSEKATGDTAARKLVSATRNNVQTNYGGRQKLIDMLAEKDPTLPAAIAGQSMNSAMPRGLVARLGAPGVAATAFLHPGNIAALPAFSPRVVGELTHAGGRAVGLSDRLAEALGINAGSVRAGGEASFQAGRMSDQEKKRQLAQALMRGNEQRASR